MSIPICSHKFTDGSRCKAAARRGTAYCQWHATPADRVLRARRERQLTRRRAMPVNVLGRPSDTMLNLQHVMNSVAQGRISGKAAWVLLTGIQTANQLRH